MLKKLVYNNKIHESHSDLSVPRKKLILETIYKEAKNWRKINFRLSRINYNFLKEIVSLHFVKIYWVEIYDRNRIIKGFFEIGVER